MQTLRITVFTIKDELRYKSFYVMGIAAIFFVLMLRGCFSGDVVVNDQKVDSVTIGYHASIIAFHLVTVAGTLVGILLAMRVLKREKDNGMQIAIMSREVSRFQYTLAKVIGTWILAYGFVFILHLTIYIIMWVNTGGRIPLFLTASLLTSLNVLFGITCVLFFSLIMPDVMAALFGISIIFISFVSDSFYAALQTGVGKSLMEQMQQGEFNVSLWRILWPKTTALQYYASSIIQNNDFFYAGPVHPAFNILIYSLIAFSLLYFRFNKQEIG
ncbi:MAG: hypothetical protein Q4F84_00585 [Fibrobacter sp.]|nr:hypothetical protein [Fibrobacter sp.]